MEQVARTLVEHVICVTYPFVLRQYRDRREEIMAMLSPRSIPERIQAKPALYSQEAFTQMVMRDKKLSSYERFIARIQDAIKELEPQEKELMGYILDSYSVDDIAKTLGMSSRSAYRERKKLFDQLAKYLLDDIYIGGAA